MVVDNPWTHAHDRTLREVSLPNHDATLGDDALKGQAERWMQAKPLQDASVEVGQIADISPRRERRVCHVLVSLLCLGQLAHETSKCVRVGEQAVEDFLHDGGGGVGPSGHVRERPRCNAPMESEVRTSCMCTRGLHELDKGCMVITMGADQGSWRQGQ